MFAKAFFPQAFFPGAFFPPRAASVGPGDGLVDYAVKVFVANAWSARVQADASVNRKVYVSHAQSVQVVD